MSDKPDKPAPEAAASDARLGCWRPPRDLTLLPRRNPNKKIFVPNLNAKRSKNRGPQPSCSGVKIDNKAKEEDARKEKSRNEEKLKKASNVTKTYGIFSEGLPSLERPSSHSSRYTRANPESKAALHRPTIRVKDFSKIDKELEEQKLKNLLGDQEGIDFRRALELDDPVQLPMGDTGLSQQASTDGKQPTMPAPINVQTEGNVKEEPVDEEDHSEPDIKPAMPNPQDVSDNSNVGAFLQSGKSTLFMVQLPDTLPGRGNGAEEDASRRPAWYDEPSTSAAQPQPTANGCQLTDLEEGLIGYMLIHRSGKVTFKMGDINFDVTAGTIPAFYEEVVSVVTNDADRTADITVLGSPQNKLIITPKWEELLSSLEI